MTIEKIVQIFIAACLVVWPLLFYVRILTARQIHNMVTTMKKL